MKTTKFYFLPLLIFLSSCQYRKDLSSIEKIAINIEAVAISIVILALAVLGLTLVIKNK
jgi:hypothetical protein